MSLCRGGVGGEGQGGTVGAPRARGAGAGGGRRRSAILRYILGVRRWKER